MNYEEFIEYIREHLVDFFERQDWIHTCMQQEDEAIQTTYTEQESRYELELHKVIKNNGVTLDGLTLRRKGESVSPNLYLNGYYDSYQMGKPMAVIMEEIYLQYQRVGAERDLEIDDLTDFAAVRDKIVVRLVNYDRNRTQLEHCPHKQYLDLAITFRYLASRDVMGMASSLITDQDFENWGIAIEELYSIALFNTMRILPWRIHSLTQMVSECVRQKAPDKLVEELLADIGELDRSEDGIHMHVLTNEAGINGATCILYDNVLRQFATTLNCNLFVMPSSIHEMMLVPHREDTDAHFLAELVSEANQSTVGLVDLLSDRIYYYDRDTDTVSIYTCPSDE